MPDYHVVHLDGNATVRSADNGITDIEWKYGCRILSLELTREQPILHYLRSNGYKVLDKNEWYEFVTSNGDGIQDIPPNIFINSKYIPDKWDAKIEIY